MDESHRIAIQRNLTSLCKGVNLLQLYPLLIEEDIIIPDDVTSLQRKFPTIEEQALEFFLWYTKRGPTAFPILVKSLRKIGSSTEADLLEGNRTQEVTANGNGSNSQSSSPEDAEFVDIRSFHPPEPEPKPEPEPQAKPSSTFSFGGPYEYLEINVREAKLYNNNIVDHTYHMMSKPRGFALIVNNVHFKNQKFDTRNGAEVDSVNLKCLLEQLGFEVTVRQDLARETFLTELDAFRRQFSEVSVDACFVAVMSHGHENVIEMSDPTQATVDLWDDIITKFNNRFCPTLMGKPKIFLVQACRGESHDFGVPRTESDSGKSTGLSDSNGTSNETERRLQPPSKIRREAEFKDILVCYSTVPGFVSNRDTYSGSWYIRTFCETVMNDAWNTEIKRLLDKVGRRMEEIISENGALQTPSYVSIGFHRKLFFNPKLYADFKNLPK